MQSDKKKRLATLFSILDSFTIRGYFGKQVRFYKVFWIHFCNYKFFNIQTERSILVSFSMIENCWCCVDQVFIFLVNISSVAWGFFSYISVLIFYGLPRETYLNTCIIELKKNGVIKSLPGKNLKEFNSILMWKIFWCLLTQKKRYCVRSRKSIDFFFLLLILKEKGNFKTSLNV